jgi:hypothetical protein
MGYAIGECTTLEYPASLTTSPTNVPLDAAYIGSTEMTTIAEGGVDERTAFRKAARSSFP